MGQSQIGGVHHYTTKLKIVEMTLLTVKYLNIICVSYQSIMSLTPLYLYNQLFRAIYSQTTVTLTVRCKIRNKPAGFIIIQFVYYNTCHIFTCEFNFILFIKIKFNIYFIDSLA